MTQPNSLKPDVKAWDEYLRGGGTMHPRECFMAGYNATRPAATDGSALREAFAWRFENGRLLHIGNLSDGECRALAALRAKPEADGGK